MVALCIVGTILLPTPLSGVGDTIMHSESRTKAKKLSFWLESTPIFLAALETQAVK